LATDKTLTPGEQVVILGYPDPSRRKGPKSDEAEKFDEQKPEPTVTKAEVVGMLAPGPGEGGSSPADALYRLSYSATGLTNSGGPIFDTAGRVVGLLTFVGPERTPAGVPIQRVRELM